MWKCYLNSVCMCVSKVVLLEPSAQCLGVNFCLIWDFHFIPKKEIATSFSKETTPTYILKNRFFFLSIILSRPFQSRKFFIKEFHMSPLFPCFCWCCWSWEGTFMLGWLWLHLELCLQDRVLNSLWYLPWYLLLRDQDIKDLQILAITRNRRYSSIIY